MCATKERHRIPEAAMQVAEARPLFLAFITVCSGSALLTLGTARADTPEAAGAETPAPVSMADALPTPPPAPARPAFEGALGPVASWSHQGRAVDTKAGFYLRYKRLSVSNTSSFAIRRNDDVFRGLGLDMVNDGRWRFNLGLRLDRGGRASDLASLNGHDRIRATVRLRASATYRLNPEWSVGTGWTADLLERGGGQTMDIGASREKALGPRLHWAVGIGLNAADSRFQRTYFGIDASRAAASGLPLYAPGSGLMNASVGTTVRMDISRSWVAFTGVSAMQRLGPQRDSPLVTWSRNWGVSAGIARRF
jgi:outer membrane protein